MKRRLLIVAVFLLAGAIVNVAVAWACAAWIDFRGGGGLWIEGRGGEQEGPSYNLWLVMTYRRSGAFRAYSMWSDRSTNSSADGFVTPGPAAPLVPDWAPFLSPTDDTGEFHSYFADARGWPLLSMWSGLMFSYTPNGRTPNTANLGIALDPALSTRWGDHRHVRLLPLRPLLLGFSVNTLLYATLLWLLIPGPFALRRFVRVKRGLCPACAYPRGESDVCSECGTALHQRAKVTAT